MTSGGGVDKLDKVGWNKQQQTKAAVVVRR
jgi:hypothetical protein